MLTMSSMPKTMLLLWIYLVAQLISNSFVSCDIYQDWDNDLYMGRQFDDLITQSKIPSSEIIIPAILVMYTPQCEHILRSHQLDNRNLPMQQFLMFAKYDYETSPKHIWYVKDYRDDLVARYKPKECLEYLYFAKGTFHDKDEPERYVNMEESKQKEVQNWIWNKLKVDIVVRNTREEDVMVKLQGTGPKLRPRNIKPGEEVVIEAYISYLITIFDVESWELLYIQKLTDENLNNEINISPDIVKPPVEASTWLKSVLEDQQKEHELTRNWRWNLANTYLHDFKLPLILPKFTDLGYKKGKIPAELYKNIIEFYKTNSKKSRSEYGSQNPQPIINYSEVGSGLVQLSKELKNLIAIGMQPLMEEWVGMPLVHTALYGIREYFKGNVLRNHVDQVRTHVVSTILQIDKDLGGEPDWELEIIGFDGIRKNVTLQPGEMLFYESATLIHGRPFPLQGRIFANSFLHYRPVNGWGWGYDSETRELTYRGQGVEPIYKFATENTLRPINLERFVETFDMEREEL